MAQSAPVTPVQPSRPAGRLLRVLGLGFGIAVTIGNTIGAGILRTPGEVAAHLPNAWLFLGVWLLGGLYAFLCASSVAELGAMLPKSGGHYVFAHHALGDYPGFFIGWCDWLSNAGSIALIAIVVGEYSGMLIRFLAGRERLTACTVVIFFTLIQWKGIRWGAIVQNLSSALKAVLFLLLAVVCLFYGSAAKPAAPPASIASGLSLLTAFILSMQSAVYTYDGWHGATYFCEEMKDPGRDVPRSMFAGVLSVTAIYLFLNVALVRMIPMSRLAGNKLALGTAASAIFGSRADALIEIVTVISLLAAINAIQLQACRVLFAMSRDRLFLNAGAHVNDGGTPDIALLFTTATALVFILSGTLQSVLAAMALFFVTSYIADFVAVFVLRRREPNRARPYRAWGYPYTTAFVLTASVAFIIGVALGDTRNSLHSLLILAASYPLYRLVKRLTAIPESATQARTAA